MSSISANPIPARASISAVAPPQAERNDVGAGLAPIIDPIRASIAAADGEAIASIKELVSLAMEPGEIGTQAQGELRSIYSDPSTSQPMRDALLNAAHELCRQHLQGQAAGDLPPTVALLGGCAKHPPVGSNGPGHQQELRLHLEAQLYRRIGDDPDILAENRMVSDAELAAAAGQLKTLEVHESPIALYTDAKHVLAQLEAVADKARGSRLPVTVWVHSGADTFQHWIPVIAQPLPGGGIHWHALNTAANSPGATRVFGKCVEALKKHNRGGQVSAHQADMQENAPNGAGVLGHRMLQALDAELSEHAHNGRDVGDMIGDHLQQWAALGAQDRAAGTQHQKAAVLASRAELLDAAFRAPEPRFPFERHSFGAAMALPLIAGELDAPAPVEAAPVAVPSYDVNAGFARQNLRVVRAPKDGKIVNQVLSRSSDLLDAINAREKMEDLSLPADRRVAASDTYARAMKEVGPYGIDRGFLQRADELAQAFRATRKSPLLMSSLPELSTARSALNTMGGEAAFAAMMIKQRNCFQACWDEANKGDGRSLRDALAELAAVRTGTSARLVEAIAQLEALKHLSDSSALNRLLRPGTPAAQIAQAREDALTLIEGLEKMKLLLVHPFFNELQAFAEKAVESEESFNAALQLFREIPAP